MALPLAPFLTSLTVYAAGKVIAALGFGFLVYSGLDSFYQQFENAVNSGLGQTPATILQIATLFGFTEYCKIILGAFSFKLSLVFIKKFVPL